MRAILTNGEVVELAKECECVTHDEPHWLHLDSIERRVATSLSNKLQDGSGTWSTLFALAAVELPRLREKRRHMERLHIEKLLKEEAL